jgi:hypothetical protein
MIAPYDVFVQDNSGNLDRNGSHYHRRKIDCLAASQSIANQKYHHLQLEDSHKNGHPHG